MPTVTNCDIADNNSQLKRVIADVTGKYVIHGVRRCNVVLTLERRYNYMFTYATQSKNWREFISAMEESWKKLKTSNVFLSFIVCLYRKRSALVRELLSNNSLFVYQLYEDKSLALRARDLIFFTTDLQTVNCYSIIHCRS